MCIKELQRKGNNVFLSCFYKISYEGLKILCTKDVIAFLKFYYHYIEFLVQMTVLQKLVIKIKTKQIFERRLRISLNTRSNFT